MNIKHNLTWRVEPKFLRNKVFRIVNGQKEYRQHWGCPPGVPSIYDNGVITNYFTIAGAQEEADRLNQK